MSNFPKQIDGAIAHLRAADPALGVVIDRSPRCDLEPHTDYFRALAGSIIGQQLSVKAARSIREKFITIGAGEFPTPDEVLAASESDLRERGLSFAKIKYVKDLARHVKDKRLDLGLIAELPNEELIVELTDVKGIGEWTAHMFLIFCLGRLDVLPTGDLGIRKGMQILYELKELPDPQTMMKLAAKNGWTDYESVASWYIWRSLDNAPV